MTADASAGAVVPTRTVAYYLSERHYLGATGRGFAWSDEYGVLVLAKPTARYLPQDGTWLELVRWCLEGERNGGSRQWARVSRWLRANAPEVTTVVSYSDPSVGHTRAWVTQERSTRLATGDGLPPGTASDRPRPATARGAQASRSP